MNAPLPPSSGAPVAGGEKLPFDPRTFLVGVLKRWPVFLLFFAAGIGAAFGAVRLLGKRTYEAQTLLMYRPALVVGETAGAPSPPALGSLADLVKVRENLEALRKALALPVSLDSLGKAVDVEVPRDSDLLVVSASWDDPDTAAKVANTLRDVFLRARAEGRRAEQIRALQGAIAEATRQLGVLKTQEDALALSVKDLEARVAAELAALQQGGDADAIRRRLERLRDAIQEDRERRGHAVELAEARREFARAQNLHASGFVSEGELQAAKARLDRVSVLASDTQEVARWKKEMQRLDRAAESGDTPVTGAETPSQPLLQETLGRVLDVQLQRVAAETEIQNLTQRLERIERPATTPGPEQSGFEIAAPARPPIAPTSSNRRVLFIAVVALFLVLGAGVTVGAELLDRNLKSPANFALKSDVPLLAALAAWKRRPPELGEHSTRPGEALRLVAERLRAALPERGARLLVVGPIHGSGATALTAQLAAQFGRLGERVVALDLGLRSEGPESGLSAAFGLGQAPGAVVDATGARPADAAPAAALATTGQRGVKTALACPANAPPDVLGAPALAAWLDLARAQATLVLLDGPPVLPYADLEAAARLADAVLLVVPSRGLTAAELRRVEGRVRATGRPLVGAILNRAHPRYLSKRDVTGGCG